MLGYGVITPGIPLFLKILDATEAQMGLAFSAYPIAFMIVVIPAGKIVDRLGENRLVISAGMFFLFLSSILLINTSSFLTFSAARAFQGIASAVSWVAVQPLASRCSGSGDNDSVGGLSYISASYGIGLIAGPLVGSLNPFSMPFIACALFSLAMCFLSFFLIKNIQSPQGNRQIAATPLLGRRGILLGCAVIFYAYLNVGVMELLFPIYMDSFFYGKLQIGILFGIIAVVLTIFQPAVVMWIKFAGIYRPLAAATLLSGISLFVFINTQSFLWWIFMSVIFGVSLGTMVTASMTLIAGASSENEQGSAYALWNMSFSLSYLIAPAVSGVMSTYIGIKVPFYLMAFFSLPVIILLERSNRQPGKRD